MCFSLLFCHLVHIHIFAAIKLHTIHELFSIVQPKTTLSFGAGSEFEQAVYDGIDGIGLETDQTHTHTHTFADGSRCWQDSINIPEIDSKRSIRQRLCVFGF